MREPGIIDLSKMSRNRSLFGRSPDMRQAWALFLAICLTLPSPAFALREMQPIQNTGLEEEIAEALERPASGMEENWNNTTTDPSQHNPKSFRYIVHAVQDPMLRAYRDLMSIQMQLDSGIQTDPGRNIDLLRAPDRVPEKPLISASFIDQDHRATWGRVGFILEVPPVNIISTNTQDVGSPFYQGLDWVRQKLRARSLMSPNALLAGTVPTDSNEVEITGTHPDDLTKKVRIIGVFVKRLPSGRIPEVPNELLRQIQGVAYRLKVPIIEVEEPVTPYQETEPEAIVYNLYGLKSKGIPYTIAFNRGGVRYLVKLEPNLSFRASAIEEGGHFSRRMTPEEFDDALRLIQASVAKHPENQDLQTAYQKIFGEAVAYRRKQVRQLHEADQAQKQGLVYYADSVPSVRYGADYVEWQRNGKRFVAKREEKGDEISWIVYSPGAMLPPSDLTLTRSGLLGDIPIQRQRVDERVMTQSKREALVKVVRSHVSALPETLKERIELANALEWLDPTFGNKSLESGLEEVVLVPTVEELEKSDDPNARQLAQEAGAAGYSHVVLIPKALSEEADFEDLVVTLFAQESVVTKAMAVLTPEKGLTLRAYPHYIPSQAERVAEFLREHITEEIQTPVVALDVAFERAVSQILPANHPLTLLLDAEEHHLMPYRKAIATLFTNLPKEGLRNLILKLNRGSVRPVTIGGRDYTAIFA